MIRPIIYITLLAMISMMFDPVTTLGAAIILLILRGEK